MQIALSLLREDTPKRQPFASQGENSQEKQNGIEYRSWI